MAFFVVHTQPGLTPAQVAEATEGDNSFIHSPRPYGELMAEAGFGEVVVEDATAAYRETVARWLSETEGMEAELRSALGDAVFEDKQTRRRRHATRAAAGLVGRSLVVGRA